MSINTIPSMALTALLCAALSLHAVRTEAQVPDGVTRAPRTSARIALSTNMPDYLYLLTPNVDAQYALDRNVTARVAFKYNSWSFRHGEPTEVKNRQMTFSAGARWWPWYTYSGWWLGASMQYQQYDRGGLFRRDSEAGDAFGAVISGGYALQVTPWLDLDFGLGFWGGYTLYTTYACPYCGRKTGEGGKVFALPDEARIALMFIF